MAGSDHEFDSTLDSKGAMRPEFPSLSPIIYHSSIFSVLKSDSFTARSLRRVHSAPSGLRLREPRPSTALSTRPGSATVLDLTRRRPSLALGNSAATIALDRLGHMPPIHEEDPRDRERRERRASQDRFKNWLKVGCPCNFP